MTLKEKLENRFPELLKKLINFSNKRKNSPVQDMLLCTAITLACSFYEFENFLPDFAVELLKLILLSVLIICWLWCSFLNGFWKKYKFIIFSILFWSIPRLVIMLDDNTGIRDYNKFLDAAAQYSRIIVQFSLYGLSNFLNTSVIYAAVTLLIWCLVLFCAGIIFKKFTKQLL